MSTLIRGIKVVNQKIICPESKLPEILWSIRDLSFEVSSFSVAGKKFAEVVVKRVEYPTVLDLGARFNNIEVQHQAPLGSVFYLGERLQIVELQGGERVCLDDRRNQLPLGLVEVKLSPSQAHFISFGNNESFIHIDCSARI